MSVGDRMGMSLQLLTGMMPELCDQIFSPNSKITLESIQSFISTPSPLLPVKLCWNMAGDLIELSMQEERRLRGEPVPVRPLPVPGPGVTR